MKHCTKWLAGGLLVLAVLAILGCPGNPIVVINDPNLEMAIRTQLRQPFGFINQSVMLQLTELDARNYDIRSLEGLQFATNLRTLDISQNQVSDLSPLSSLGLTLETLDAEDNDLYDLTALRGLVNLRALNLCGNPAIANLNPLVVNASNNGLGVGDQVTVDCQLEEADPQGLAELDAAGVALTCCEGTGESS